MKVQKPQQFYSINDFNEQFPDDTACLEHLMKSRYGLQLNCPKCGKYGKFHLMTGTPAYACAWCGHHIHPMAGTIFQDTRTPLKKWFHAIFLFTTSRNGVAAKELQRYLDISYKVAWRMGHQIRTHMANIAGFFTLSGTVEIDETYVGGKRSGKRGRGAAGKTIVMGMLEKAGHVKTRVVANVKRITLQPVIKDSVAAGTTIHTDELLSYGNLSQQGYVHETVNHAKKQWVRGDVHVNGCEGFWSMIKRSILGTHISVSPQHLHKYLAEFEFRYNQRHAPKTMFAMLITGF